jgi:8-oxo-dGTP pyrophosphatase MutT (NUDIX family)
VELLQRFRTAITAHPWRTWPPIPGRLNNRKAGVLVPIVPGKEWGCILTLRPAGLRRHGGEFCFPGGKPEKGDRTLQDTALREAREELDLQGAEIIGRLSSIPLYTSEFRLEPFVGLAKEQPLQPDPQEVQEVIRVNLHRALLLPSIDGSVFDLGSRKILSPIFDVGALVEGPPTDTPIFGATAHVLYELITVFAAAMHRSAPPVLATDRRLPVH